MESAHRQSLRCFSLPSQLLTCESVGQVQAQELLWRDSLQEDNFCRLRIESNHFTSALLNLTRDNNVHSNEPFVPSARSTQLLYLRPIVLSHNDYYLMELKGLQILGKVQHAVMIFAAFVIGMVRVYYKLTWLQDISIRCIP